MTISITANDHRPEFIRTYRDSIVLDARQLQGIIPKEELRQLIPEGAGIHLEFRDRKEITMRVLGKVPFSCIFDKEEMPASKLFAIKPNREHSIKIGRLTLQVSAAIC